MSRLTLVLGATVLGNVVASAQPATPAQMAGVGPNPGFGTMHLRTRLGSFKVINGQGRMEVNFTGTIMVSQLQGTFQVTGNVRKEYEKHGRVIYTGKGKAVAAGKWRGLQWFGRDLSGVWYGQGMIRLAGEFDRDQKTGEYWFENPAEVLFWPGATTTDISNPPNRPGQNPNVKIKKKG